VLGDSLAEIPCGRQREHSTRAGTIERRTETSFRLLADPWHRSKSAARGGLAELRNRADPERLGDRDHPRRADAELLRQADQLRTD
jgi:hypothetical protein